MTVRFRRSSLGAALLLTALALCAACTDSADGKGGAAGGSTARPRQTADSLFDGAPVTIAVKKGQPGFSTVSGGEYGYTGFDVSLSHFLAHEAGFRETLRGFPAGERERRLADGDADLAVASYTITDARDRKIDFTAPYLKTYQGLLVRRHGSGIEKLDDARGRRVCSVAGSTSDPGSAPDRRGRKEINKAIGVDVRIGLRKDYTTCVRELRRGNVDAVWTDKILLEGFAQTPPYSRDVKVVKGITIENRQFYGIGIAQGHRGDCRRINRVLRKFLDGSWRDTFREHFPALAQRDPDFEQTYKPTDDEFAAYAARSCGAR